jgi:hypothetical protein
LKKEGISDPFLLQRIREGKLTVAQIKQEYENIETIKAKLENNVSSGRTVEVTLSNPWVQARIIEGMLTLEKFTNPSHVMIHWTAHVLTDTQIQKWLDQDPNRQYIGWVADLPFHVVNCLRDVWFRERIDKQTISFEQLAEATEFGIAAFSDREIGPLLKSQPQKMKRALQLSTGAKRALGADWVRKRFKEESITFEQIAGLNDRQGAAIPGSIPGSREKPLHDWGTFLAAFPQYVNKVLHLCQEDVDELRRRLRDRSSELYPGETVQKFLDSVTNI